MIALPPDLPFVESLARRVAASMPHSIELGDLVQDGMIGLIDAACRFDEARGIKFETFAERRVRGAMIDALRRDAWPRGVRRQRRELEAAREELRRELGAEPSLADLAARVGSDEARLGRTIVRINTIESDVAAVGRRDTSTAPRCLPALVPSEPLSPDKAYEEHEVRDRVRAAIASLPPRERKVIGAVLLRRSDDEADWRRDRRQRIARLAAARPRRAAASEGARRGLPAAEAAAALRPRSSSFQQTMRRMRMAKAEMPREPGVVLPVPQRAGAQDTVSAAPPDARSAARRAVAAAR